MGVMETTMGRMKTAEERIRRHVRRQLDADPTWRPKAGDFMEMLWPAFEAVERDAITEGRLAEARQLPRRQP